jgi:hypothetical protein
MKRFNKRSMVVALSSSLLLSTTIAPVQVGDRHGYSLGQCLNQAQSQRERNECR